MGDIPHGERHSPGKPIHAHGVGHTHGVADRAWGPDHAWGRVRSQDAGFLALLTVAGRRDTSGRPRAEVFEMMRRLAVAIVVLAVLTAACGGDLEAECELAALEVSSAAKLQAAELDAMSSDEVTAFVAEDGPPPFLAVAVESLFDAYVVGCTPDQMQGLVRLELLDFEAETEVSQFIIEMFRSDELYETSR